MARAKQSAVVWLRRASQTGFLLLFLYLFLQTVYRPVNETGKGIKLFFQVDPLTALATGVAAHTLATGLALGGITVVVTLLAGRWFCGWVCPFGALHNLISAMRSNSTKSKIAAGRYTEWQKSKYHLLVLMLAACLFGLNLFGLFDPFSFFFRSLATVVFPALNDLVTRAFTAIYQTDPGLGPLRLTKATEPVYEFLRRHALSASQQHYHGTFWIGALFGAAVLLNLYRARYWCRYVCPLGALLGVIGKNPAVRLKRKQEACNDCGLCVADCQGGANPAGASAWKPAECFYCWNCHSACPHQALVFIAGPEREAQR